MPVKSLLLTTVVFSACFLYGQRSSSPTPVEPYRISLIDGEGSLNNLASDNARDPVIRVVDSNRQPVAGAYVEFDTPGSGPGASFQNDSTHFATTTNNDGLAVGPGIKNNGIPGAYVIEVHVSCRGQSIGEVQMHQNNISAIAATHLHLGKATDPSGEAMANVALSNDVIGMALGDHFLMNGDSTPINANLLDGTRIQSLSKPITLYLHDHCEYLVEPHSSITINAKRVTLEKGSIRARHFGDCSIVYGGLAVTGSPTSDGMASLSGQNLEVASLAGNVQVVNSEGDKIGTLPPGTVSMFEASSAATGR